MPSHSPYIRIVQAAATVVLASAAAFAAPSSKPALPASFAGWQQQSSAPQSPTPADAAALKEFGLTQATAATYEHGAQKVTLQAFSFPDATGAYGAFTYFRQPDMRDLKIGNGGAANGTHYAFWSGATMVEADFARPDAAARHVLSELAAALPKTAGPEAIAPSLPAYLPAQALDPASVHYSLGPASYAHDGGQLPAQIIDFSRDAEVVSGEYRARRGKGTLTLINYPTPQMALDREHAFAAALKANPSAFGASDPESLLVRRAGPLLAVTTGHLDPGEARKLLDDIHYNAGIVWSNTLAGSGEAKKTASLLLSIAYMTIALALAALVLGVFLGGGRALIRMARGKPLSTMNDDDFISLKLGR